MYQASCSQPLENLRGLWPSLVGAAVLSQRAPFHVTCHAVRGRSYRGQCESSLPPLLFCLEQSKGYHGVTPITRILSNNKQHVKNYQTNETTLIPSLVINGVVKKRALTADMSCHWPESWSLVTPYFFWLLVPSLGKRNSTDRSVTLTVILPFDFELTHLIGFPGLN